VQRNVMSIEVNTNHVVTGLDDVGELPFAVRFVDAS